MINLCQIYDKLSGCDAKYIFRMTQWGGWHVWKVGCVSLTVKLKLRMVCTNVPSLCLQAQLTTETITQMKPQSLGLSSTEQHGCRRDDEQVGVNDLGGAGRWAVLAPRSVAGRALVATSANNANQQV